MAPPLQSLTTIFEAMHAGHLVLMPNHRIYIQLLEGYGEWRREQALSPVCITPQGFPIDIWLRRQWYEIAPWQEHYTRILEPAQEAMVWHDIIEQSEHGAALINKQATARAVQEAWQTAHLWDINFEELYRLGYSQQQVDYAEDFSVFADWVKAFETFCTRHRLISLSPLVEKIIGHLENKSLQAPKNILFTGFANPPPLYSRLINQLESSSESAAHFQALSMNPVTRVEACQDTVSEFVTAANWARDILDAEPAASIGIISQEKNQHAEQFSKILGDILSELPGITLGNPDLPTHNLASRLSLARTPIINAALSILDLNSDWVESLSFCKLLRSPFLSGSSAENFSRAELEYRLRESGELKIRMAWIHELSGNREKPTYCEQLSINLLKLANARREMPHQADCASWCSLFEGQLETVGWPGERELDRIEILALQEWSKILKQFKESSQWCGKMSLTNALSRLRQLVSSGNTGSGQYQAAVQVLTPTEADGLHFTHTWVLGLSEQQWPPSRKPTPFIPISLQRKAGITECDVNALASQALEQLEKFRSHCINEIVLSYPCQQDDLTLKPATMLRHFDEEFYKDVPSQALNDLHPVMTGLCMNNSNELFTDSAVIPLSDDEIIKGSVSLVSNQADCPFQAYANHRLKVRDLPGPVIGLPANVLGSILHEVLQRFWQTIRSQQELLDKDTASLELLLTEIIADVLRTKARFYPHTMTGSFLALESNRLKNLLLNWFEEEGKRGTFDVLATEQKVQWTHADLAFEMRIDRLDKTGNGNLVLVDYKSGKNSEINWLDERQTEPQLMLYLQAVESSGEGKVDGVFIAQVHIEESRYKGISNNDEIYPGSAVDKKSRLPETATWESIRQQWELSLSSLVNEFVQGYVPVAPKTYNSCAWCHLQSFCRINESVIP